MRESWEQQPQRALHPTLGQHSPPTNLSSVERKGEEDRKPGQPGPHHLSSGSSVSYSSQGDSSERLGGHWALCRERLGELSTPFPSYTPPHFTPQKDGVVEKLRDLG